MPKTDKERLQDNNTALLRIKGKAQNLPDVGGDVKLFDTVEHMQADTNPKEDGLAIVYASTQANLTADDEGDFGTVSDKIAKSVGCSS